MQPHGPWPPHTTAQFSARCETIFLSISNPSGGGGGGVAPGGSVSVEDGSVFIPSKAGSQVETSSLLFTYNLLIDHSTQGELIDESLEEEGQGVPSNSISITPGPFEFVPFPFDVHPPIPTLALTLIHPHLLEPPDSQTLTPRFESLYVQMRESTAWVV